MDVADRMELRDVVYIMKRWGPSTDPCGTPHDREVEVDWWPLGI